MEKLNYDPRKIISQRRQKNKNKSFEHQSVEGMDKIVNLLEFEEDCEEVEEEIIEAGEEKGNVLATIVHTPSNSTLVNKRSLSERDIMDFNDENSNIRLKTQPEREIAMQDEQSADDEKKVLFYNNNMYK